MKQTKLPFHARQGDVLIERIDSMPKNLKKVKRENGNVIFAYGESTGHSHAIADAGTEKFQDEQGREFFKIKGRQIRASLPIVRRWKNQVMVKHPEFGLIEFAISDVAIVGDTVQIDGEFALLKHDEHHTHGIPAGFYRGGGAGQRVNQSEYSPEAIRNVMD